MRHNPLRRCAASPFSLRASRSGKGDDASDAGRPLRGVRWPGPRPLHAMAVTSNAKSIH